jgi:(p)ppGpp synthase/HD superfamily hydrolase
MNIDQVSKPLNASVHDVKIFACEAHDATGQKYADKPYSHHLQHVEDKTVAYLYLLETPWERVVARKGAWVHDLLEDIKTISYKDLLAQFGYEVAEISYLLDTGKGRTRAERHSDAYYEAISKNRLATFVKIADRLANAEASFLSGGSMLKRYRQEYEHFAKFLKPAYPQFAPMWAELDTYLLTA